MSVAYAGDINVIVNNIKKPGDYVYAALYNSPQTYMDVDKACAKQRVKAEGNSTNIKFDKISAGTYAVTVFYDTNENEKLDKNIFGKPLEPYGFSNNAKGHFGPPSFDKTKFSIDENTKRDLNIDLVY